MTDLRRIGGSRPRPKPIQLHREAHFIETRLDDDRAFPIVMRRASPNVDAIAAAGLARTRLRARLLEVGAILFRDCGIDSAARFEAFIGAIAGEGMHYTERSSPRSNVGGHVYTSTDYPADQPILPHNENSYAHQWPMTIAFFCETPPDAGGETPIVDVRRVLARLDDPIRDAFEQRGVCYVRNYVKGLGLTWSQVFQTTRRDEVERYCAEAGYQVEWRGADGDTLRTRRIAPAVRRHPRTGEAVWFNHALFFHVTSLPAAARDVLLAQFGEEDWPHHTRFGDGAPIPAEYLDAIRQAYDAETVRLPWQRGDVLLLDNMLVAHARAPFSGTRRVLVCMAEPHRDEERLQLEDVASWNQPHQVS